MWTKTKNIDWINKVREHERMKTNERLHQYQKAFNIHTQIWCACLCFAKHFLEIVCSRYLISNSLWCTSKTNISLYALINIYVFSNNNTFLPAFCCEILFFSAGIDERIKTNFNFRMYFQCIFPAQNPSVHLLLSTIWPGELHSSRVCVRMLFEW